MKKKLLLLVLLLLAVGGGVYWWQFMHKAPRDTTQLTLYGNVEIREVDLAFDASGHVLAIEVEEGDRVQPGQTLARLNPNKLEAALVAAEATVTAQKQALAKLKTGSRPQEIRQTRAQADALAAKSLMARISYQRLLKMGQKKLAAPEEIDQARAAAEAAEAEARAAEETHALAVVGPRAEDIAMAEAELAARRAEEVLARARLADATLLAPASGIVRQRILEPGDMASPQTPVLTLAINDPLWVRSYVPETDLGRVRIGMAAEIQSDSFPGKSYRGWVGFLSPTAEFTPKNVETPELRTRLVYQARVFVCDPQEELRLGMPATVILALDTPPKADTQLDRRCAE